MSTRAVATLGALLGLVSACDPQKGQWGLEAVTTLPTPADPDAGCGVVLPTAAATAAQQASRAACGFGPGDTAAATLGITPALAGQIPIRHVIVMMKENRSFDHLLGKLHDRGQPDSEALPASFTNPDLAGVAVPYRPADTTCLAHDPAHQYSGMTAGVNGGRMDGFVKNAASSTGTDGHWVMSVNDQPQLPFYYFLASTFALADRHFAPARSGTFCNRNFLYFGTSAGAVDTGIVYPEPNTPSLMTLLLNAGYTWGTYSDDAPLSATLGWTHQDPGTHTLQDLYDALDHGTLPNVAFVDALEDVEDDHPTADLQKGEAALRTLYQHAVASPQWGRLALIWTYDEGGGFPDHVPPPDGCPVPGSPFIGRGPRVPLVMISPWARRHHVSHLVQDHTAITRFIGTLFGLPALTRRDANSEALFDLLDFSCGRSLSVPDAPAAGTGGCVPP